MSSRGSCFIHCGLQWFAPPATVFRGTWKLMKPIWVEKEIRNWLAWLWKSKAKGVGEFECKRSRAGRA